MANLTIIFIALFIGILLQRLKTLPKDAHVVINTIILHVPLPAIALLTIPGLKWDPALLGIILVAWITIGLSFLFFTYLGKKFNWDRSLVGCLILTAGHGNTAFVGFPVIEALFGKDSLKYAVLIDQPGSFLICSTIGIWLATTYSSGQIRKRDVAAKVAMFPPFIGFACAFVLGFLGWEAQGLMREVLERLASILTPLALISVGLQLRAGDIRNELKPLCWGLGFKLILAPTVIYVIYKLAGLPQEIFRVVLMESAMAPMITSSILAASYNLRPRLAGAMVGVGVPLSFLTLFAWYQLL